LEVVVWNSCRKAVKSPFEEKKGYEREDEKMKEGLTIQLLHKLKKFQTKWVLSRIDTEWWKFWNFS